MKSPILSVICLVVAGWSAPAAAQDAPCGRYPSGQAVYDCTCTGTETGSVWGSGPYTADSAICVAARHAGVIGTSGGAIRALHRPGQASYEGSERNGVRTSSWGSYGDSFDVVTRVAACERFPVGQASHDCACTGTETGSVWGSNPYTSDSAVCVAARHAGAVGAGGGTVTALGGPGFDSFPGSTANGVQTSSWGAYGSSFSFKAASAGVPAAPAACARYPLGQASYTCACTGSEGGSVWGSGPYTADSALCVAARHAGVIDGRGGTVTVIEVRGLEGYTGTIANGVQTSNWGAYGASVVFNRN